MNKIIVSIAIALGLLVSVGFGEEKKEYDPRLILPKGQVWSDGGSWCSQELYFYTNGTFIFVNFCKNKPPYDTVKGTWYTINDTLYQHVAQTNIYLPENSKDSYSITNDYELFIDSFGIFKKSKK